MIEIPENFLFDLIKSLTAGEKRSITLLNNNPGKIDKQHLVLFNALNVLPYYDELKLKQKLKESGINTPLPILTSYLKDRILKSLRFYHSNKSVELKISNLITDTIILHNKGLEKYRNKSLQKAKKLAITYQKNNLLLEICNKEWQYRSSFFPKKHITSNNVLQTILKQEEFRELDAIKATLMGKGDIRDEQLKKEWDALIKHPLLSKSKEDKGYEQTIIYHNILMRYFLKNNNFKKSLFHQQKLIRHMESRTDLLQDHKERYIDEVSSLIAAYAGIGDFELAKGGFTKLLEIQKWRLTIKEQKRLIDSITLSHSNFIMGCHMYKQYTEAMKFAIQSEIFLNNHPFSYSHYALALYFEIAKTALYKGYFAKSLEWNNKILTIATDKRTSASYIVALLLDLIIQFELHNFDYLESHLDRVVYFFKKRKLLFKTESIILKYLKNKFPNSNSYRETLTLFKEMKRELEELKKNPYEARAFEYFDYTVWLQSKIENKTLMEVLV